MSRAIDVFFYLTCFAGWIAIAYHTDGIGWAVGTVLGSFHLGGAACLDWRGKLE